MTPDMKRLCDAVWAVEATATFRDATGEQSSADANPHERRRYEAIICAVLMALREPGDAVAIAGGKAECMAPSAYGPLHENEALPIGEEAAIRAFAAMINAILSGPAKA